MTGENVVNWMQHEGAIWHIGGELEVESGGYIDIESGGMLKFAGTDKTAILAAAVAKPVAGGSSGYALSRGAGAGMTGAALITTELTTVTAVVASLVSAPSTFGGMFVSAEPSSTVASKIYVTVWIPTAVNDVTPKAATSLATVGWVAIGTV